MIIPLEDTVADIVGKAQRGLQIADSDLAGRTGLSLKAIQAVRTGHANEADLRVIAPVLNVHPEALIAAANQRWRPEPVELRGLAMFNTPFDDMTVNSYVIFTETGEAAAFDTGSDCSPMLDFLREKNLSLKLILLTHTHGDHILDLDRLVSKTGAAVWVSERERLDGAEPFAAGREFQLGTLRIETRLTWGHSPGGITYVVRGLERTVAIVGDALFAGSMGGGMVSYGDALRTNREEIFSLPDETVVCPGHGPMTTVGEEKRHNPFFATSAER